MRRAAPTLAVLFACGLAACGSPKLHISSTAEAAGAEILVDGKAAGVMRKSGEASSAHISVPSGTRRVVIVKDGRRYEAEIKVQGEAYADLDLENGTLTGG